MNWYKYKVLLWPLLASVVMAVLLGYREAATSDGVSASEWVILGTQVLMIVSAWGAANIPGWEKGKGFQAGVLAVMALLVSLVTGGISGDEIMQLVIAFMAAAGVSATGGPVHPALASVPARNPLVR